MAIDDALYLTLTNIGIVAFTVSLVFALLLFLLIWPNDRLEWAVTIKTAAYVVVMLRACGVTFLGWPRENVAGLAVFLLATAATVWFVICAWQEWLTRRMQRP